ncbi:MAG: DUF1232 domain-containing protein [Clostridiales Family XIII bacterium]|jgi:uncharacterized membrane protein YkvA (DUF1232 family)|nr:DUF1232 domain-containing protein [Clostridiales Family XIII bacterium]
MNFFTWSVLSKRVGAIKSLMKDNAVPRRQKFLVAFGIFYLILPLDIIPAVLFPIAWMDDLVLWIFIIYSLKESLDKYWLGEKTIDITENFEGKEFIDEAHFTIEDESDDE